MGDFFGDELDEIGDELVKAWVALYAVESGDLVFPTVFIEQVATDILEVELDFFR